MANNKNDPGKKPSQAGDSGGIKKPVPTLDLKATEIKKPGTGDPAKSSQADASKAAGGKSGSGGSVPTAGSATSTKPTDADKKPDDKTATGSTAGSSAGASSPSKPGDAESAAASASGRNGKPGDTNKPGDRSKAAPPPRAASSAKPPPKTSSAGGIGGFVSHLTAGVVGGFLALLGADTLGPQIAPQLGLPSLSGQNTQATQDLTQRLAALEKSVADQGAAAPREASGELAEKLAATEKRLAELEGLNTKLEELAQTQQQLSARADSLDQKVAETSESAGAAPDERVAKLEQQLATLVAAAGQDPDAQGIPQLAAVTGRVADLEQALENQIAALRASVAQDMDTRVQAIAEASEQARSGTTRIDRALAGVTTDTARLGQRLEAVDADTARLTEGLTAVKEDTGAIRSELKGFKSDIEAKVAKLASPDDVSAAVKPVQEQVASLKNDVAGVVRAEEDRRANAKRIVLSLELANLKRALERGEGFSEELAEVKKASSGLIDVAELEKHATSGVPTQGELEASFRPVVHQIIDANTTPQDGSVFDQLLAGAKSVVRVRKVNHDTNDNSTAAVVGRMEKALQAGQYGIILDQASKLSAPAGEAAKGWLAQVQSRHAVDLALAQIEDQLKTSLSGGPDDASTSAETVN